MTGIDFLEKMNDIDSDLLEAAESYKPQKKNLWNVWIPIAAALIFAAGLGFLMSQNKPHTVDYQNTQVAFYFDNAYHEPLALNDYIRLGLAEQQNDLRGGVRIDPITKEDLDECIGELVFNIDDEAITCKLYRHVKFPSDRSICIVEFPGNDYQMYIVKER